MRRSRSSGRGALAAPGSMRHWPQLAARQAVDKGGRGLRRFRRLFGWGHSSAGRALAWHARGRRFDPAWLHHYFALAVRLSPSSRGPGHRPFTAVTGVRIPLGTPVTSMCYKFDVDGIPVSGKAGMVGGAGRRPASLDDRLAYIAHLRRRITRRTVHLAVRSKLFCRTHLNRSGNAWSICLSSPGLRRKSAARRFCSRSQ